MSTPVRSQKAELIHIETDRRLGHEWDEWNGKPLPNRGNFSAPPSRFFGFAALALGVLCATLWLAWFALAPRLASLWTGLPGALLLLIAAASLVAWLWYLLLAASFYGPVL